MRSALCWLALFATLLAAPVSAEPGDARAPDAPWRDPARWSQLRLGMGPGQVLELLGEPGRITRYYAFTRWEYPDALGRRVNFDERGRLVAWGDRAR